MSCTRCQGLMLEEHMIDMEGGYGEMWSFSWRCFTCGHRDDAVLQHHRQAKVQPVEVSPQAVSTQEAFGVVWGREDSEPLAT